MLGQKLALDTASPYPRLKGIEYIEVFVGNVRQAAHYYRTVWGFQPVAFQGLDTGSRDRVSVDMRQDKMTLLVTGAIESSSEIAQAFAVARRGRREGCFLGA